MKRGVPFIPLPNPPVFDEEIMGVKVRYAQNYPGIAESRGFLRRKYIIVGPLFTAMEPLMQRAVLLHEAKHCLAWHLEKRVVMACMLLLPCAFLPPRLFIVLVIVAAGAALVQYLAREQEAAADAFAVKHGYGEALALFLQRMHRPEPSPFYHDYERRQDAIAKLLKQRR